MDRIHQVIIVGAGLCGLAVAHRLERAGVPFTMLERATRIAEPWRSRHEQLRLNTHRYFSRLSGLAPARHSEPFMDRDTVIDYLEYYARNTGANIEYSVDAQRIDPGHGNWEIRTWEHPLPRRAQS